MTKRAVTGVGLVVVCSVGVLARQSTLPKVGMTVQALQAWATRMIDASTASDSVWTDSVMPAPTLMSVHAIQTMGAAERLALTREVLATMKAHIMTPAFRAAHTAKIAKLVGRPAVNHGVDELTYGMTTDPSSLTMIAVSLIYVTRSMPPDHVKDAFEAERAELAETIKSETGAERAKAQKDLARLNALAPLMNSNPEEFKRQYSLAKSAAMGGPDTEARFQAAAASGQDTDRIRLEQANWNRINLTMILRKNLTKFVNQATTMDFKRVTFMNEASMYWGTNMGNRDLMSPLEQLERHLGPAPTAAAVQVARAWLKELQ
jgi:hypothetical protein